MGGVPRELIRLVRQCKTAAEERKVIAKESAALREAFSKQETTFRHRNVAKMMYIHMLGYPTHFGQMECLKLIAAQSFAEKADFEIDCQGEGSRIGYLGMMILLDERQEVLMLVTNSLKHDLNNENQNIVGLALVAMGNICSAEMARDLSPDVESLLHNGSSYIKKKAALCAVRILKKVPDLVDAYQEISIQLLSDRQHGVLLTAVMLISQICQIEESDLTEYRRHVPQLCRILRSLVVSGYSPEHDCGGINDPFLQVQILRLLRILGHQDVDASDQMSDILAQVATNTESVRTTGNSILYECVQTVMNVESSSGLRVLGINILGRFLSNTDNNIRYVALNTLSKVVAIDAQAVQRHRETIVECVKDADVSIRKIALELVYALVNETNIKTLTKELLDYLTVSDAEFKSDLASKICLLIQRFAPDKRWHVDNIIKILIQAGQYVKEEVCRGFIVLITNTPTLQSYTSRALYTALKDNVRLDYISLMTVSIWCMGEYGESLLNGAEMVDGEETLEVMAKEIVDVLQRALKQMSHDDGVREYVLTALMKLTPKLPSERQRIEALLGSYKTDITVEVQQRCCEYAQILQHEQLHPQLFERMPALDEQKYIANLGIDVALVDENGTTENGTKGNVHDNGAADQDLLGLDDILRPEQAAPSQPQVAFTILDDLLGTTPEAAAPAEVTSPPSRTAPPVDLLDMLSMEVAPIGEATQRFPSIIAYENHGIKGMFDFKKASDSSSEIEIKATYSTTGVDTITEFSVQVAVPKFMTLKLHAASSHTLSPAHPVVQKLDLSNSQHGQKPMAMRLKVAGKVGDQTISDMAEVRNFPPGL